jgi:hypothetical protein
MLQEWIAKYPDYDDDSFIEINPLIGKLPQQRPTAKKQAGPAPVLFAKVGDIEIYREMPAAFLKSLRS